MITIFYKYALLLFFIPFLLRFFSRRSKPKHQALKVPFFDEISSLQEKKRYKRLSKITLTKLLVWGIWISLVIAVARPQSIGQKILTEQDNRVMVLVLDSSGSMQEPDFMINNKRVSRFFAMKEIVADFIKKRSGDKIGIVLFGTNAYVYAPPTDDTNTLLYLLNTTKQGIVGGSTAIGDGLALAVKMVKDLPQEQRIAILLSDGVSNAGLYKDKDALALAKENNVKIYTIAMGGTKNQSFFGLHLTTENLVDEETLKEMASETGGKFYLAQNSNELNAIYDEINIQEPIKNNDKYFTPTKELFYIPLSFAFFLSIWLFIFIMRDKK